MMDNTVTVVIPNWNGLKYLDTCLDSLKTQTYRAFEILVVDNGSTDGSAEWLREKEKENPRLRCIFLEENTGFSGAVNLGIEKSGTPYVILLNNDIRCDEHYVEEMVKAVESSKKIFSVSCKMIQMYHPDLLDDAGDMYTIAGWAFQRGVGRSARCYRRAGRVFSACAGAAIYRRAVFAEIGLFDEMHFAYLEDIDVGYRARIAGYENFYAPRAVVWHVGSGTSGSKYNSFKVRLAARNNVYLNVKNMPFPQLLLNALPIAAGAAVKYGFFKKLGFGKDYLSGFLEGIRTCGKCRKVPFRPENLRNYLVIEADLIAGMMLYLREFALRRMAGKKAEQE